MQRKDRSMEKKFERGRRVHPTKSTSGNKFIQNFFQGEGSMFVPKQTNHTFVFMLYNSANPQEKKN